jgi:RNA polymerase sigma factor (sigma-70 family)
MAASTSAEPSGDSPDGSLLSRFIANRDQDAFTTLVERHEQMVFGVCQRVLGDAQAAEDASQATFMVLARKAVMLDRERPLAGWLYAVAYHIALRLQAVVSRRRRLEKRVGRIQSAHVASPDETEVETREVHQALREELHRLPAMYRLPLTLHYFEGCTHKEVARAIGMPRGSIAKRIGEGLRRLRERLGERGISL